MNLYNSLAEWWPLLSPPEDYEEEAAIYSNLLISAGNLPARTVLELGCGGGNNASHMKLRFAMTLTDVAENMLAVSRQLNPECEHINGDMRTLRLGREFDRVFIHDAICYMATAEDLSAAVTTAFVHCRPGGAALFVPDFVRENFRTASDHDGSDLGLRGLRYLEWVWDPDPADTSYAVDYAYMLRSEDGSVRVEHERHTEGLFSRAEWLVTLEEAGFKAYPVILTHSEVDYEIEAFVGIKPT